MFPFWPFWGYSCCGNESMSRQAHRERKLKFLRWMRDDLETRLAGLNAAIETLERQISQEDAA